jgi:hypothetical protein
MGRQEPKNIMKTSKLLTAVGMREPFQRLPTACDKLLKQFSGAGRVFAPG